MYASYVNPDEIVIIVITGIEEEDLLPIISNLEFSKNILLICDNYFDFLKNNAYKTSFIVDRLKDVETLLAKISMWKKKNKKSFSGIIGLDEEYRYRISEAIAKKFSIDYYSRETLGIASNKFLQKIEFGKVRIAVPGFKLISKKTRLDAIGFPNVVKIATGISSKFVYLNRNENDLRKNISKIIASSQKNSNFLFFNAANAWKNIMPHQKNNFLLEEFIEGDEYSCDFIVNKSKTEVVRVVKKMPIKGKLGLFDAFILFNPDYEECGFKLKDVAAVCGKIAKAFRISSGMGMADFKFNKKMFVIEASVRPGISTFIDLMAEVYGFTSINKLIRQKLNLPVAAAIPPHTDMAIYIFAPHTGLLKKFDTSQIEKSAKEFGIIKIVKYYKAGDNIIKVNNDISLGYVLLKNINLKHAAEVINNIRSRIIVEVC